MAEGVAKNESEAEQRRLECLTELAVDVIEAAVDTLVTHPDISAGERPVCTASRFGHTYSMGIGLRFSQVEIPFARFAYNRDAGTFKLALEAVFEKAFPEGAPGQSLTSTTNRTGAASNLLDHPTIELLRSTASSGPDPPSLAEQAARRKVAAQPDLAIAAAIGLTVGSLDHGWTDEQGDQLIEPALCAYHLGRIALGTSDRRLSYTDSRSAAESEGRRLALAAADAASGFDLVDIDETLDAALSLRGHGARYQAPRITLSPARRLRESGTYRAVVGRALARLRREIPDAFAYRGSGSTGALRSPFGPSILVTDRTARQSTFTTASARHDVLALGCEVVDDISRIDLHAGQRL